MADAQIPFETIDPWYDVPEHLKTRIYKPKWGFVTALLQKQIRFGVTQQWSAPFSDLLKGLQRSFEAGKKLGRGIVGAGETAVDSDVALVFKELSSLVWVGTGPMGGVLRLTYLARHHDAFNEVTRPCLRLLEFCSAGVGASATISTGQGALSVTALRKPEPMQIELGYMILYRNVVPQSIDVNWYSDTDDLGHSVRADVDIKFTGQRVYTRRDEDVEFNRGQWSVGEPA